MSAYACPVCGSEDTQSFPVIYESGSYSGGTSTYGTAYVGGKAVPAVGYSTHGGRSALASRLAPPQRAGIGCGGVVGVLLLIVGLFGTLVGLSFMSTSGRDEASIISSLFIPAVGAFWALLGGFVAVRAFRKRNEYNRHHYPAALDRWRNSYFCHRGGHEFVLTP